MTVALSDELPFYDNPDECKPCQYCGKPMYRRDFKWKKPSCFRRRKFCSRNCGRKLQSGVRPGRQYNSLTVLCEGEPYIEPNGTREVRWVCKCVCGETLSVRSTFLKNSHTKSCGCGGNIALYQKFGMLKTLKRTVSHVKSDGSQLSKWLCECDCGLITSVLSINLLSGSTTSCGCKTTTRLEDTIERSLNRLNVSYKKEYTPKPLVNKGFQYRLDFYLPKHKVNIEADGNVWHGGGNKYKSAKEQIAYDKYRNWWVQEALNCYILRLSEDFLDYKPWNFLDNRLGLFLRSTLKPSPKDRPWSRVTYWTLNNH